VKRKVAGVLTGLLMAALSACGGGDYRPFDPGEAGGAPLDGAVHYALSDVFFRDPPDCIAILPVLGAAASGLGRPIEAAASRMIAARVPRTIGAEERRRIERKFGLDPESTEDRGRFASLTGCRFGARPRVLVADNLYAVFWSRRRIGIALDIVRYSDNTILWRATHDAHRDHGGLPFSPLAIGTATARAGIALSDGEAVLSMIDDVMRRIAVTLPDIR
jgi:hypothetical protein